MQFEFDLKICDGVDLVMDFDCKFEKDPVPVLTWFLGTERVNPVEYLITRPCTRLLLRTDSILKSFDICDS